MARLSDSTVYGQLQVTGDAFFNANTTFDGTINGVALSLSGNITVGGTVDGRDIAADGTKLDGIESGATADQTASEIKTAYESNTNTNAFTDSFQTKLTGIEAGAEVNEASSTDSTANTLAKRDGSGDINARLFKSEYDTTNSTINYIMTQIDTATNNYIRPSTPDQVRHTLDNPVESISTNTTAVRSRFYVITASLTLTLPASPEVGSKVSFANASGSETVVIGRNGQNIMGIAENMILDDIYANATLTFTGATKGWVFNT